MRKRRPTVRADVSRKLRMLAFEPVVDQKQPDDDRVMSSAAEPLGLTPAAPATERLRAGPGKDI
ncbi:hypothetical protein HEP86_30390 [Streptomyces sp. RPA4-5]|uniref:hypothetical protein n=1 Tax=Streptomyces sp. RPA4-5 TaxID=2721245 RepID=UPI00143E42AC|nr:hypothetical protein [Streptomyces sp. RPA4-5]QIY58045.1 hypothetical protein HEP86_30390 [Streptomyces sp. RPA4-5]